MYGQLAFLIWVWRAQPLGNYGKNFISVMGIEAPFPLKNIWECENARSLAAWI